MHYIGDEVKFILYDEDVDEDHVFGATSVELSSLCISSGIDQWIQLESDGEQTSSLRLKGTWAPNAPETPPSEAPPRTSSVYSKAKVSPSPAARGPYGNDAEALRIEQSQSVELGASQQVPVSPLAPGQP